MSKPFDATLKDIVQLYAGDWAARLDMAPAGPVEVLTPDLSTVTAAADIVLRVGDTLLHLDFQSGPSAALPRRTLLYNALLHQRYELPVHSVLVLLRQEANLRVINGSLQYEARPGRGGLRFDYEVMRLWEIPAEELLGGSMGLLPLAPLGQLPAEVPLERSLRSVVERLVDRITQEVPAERAGKLIWAAYILSGLRIEKELARAIFSGVRAVHESSTYQLIIDEGRVQEARRILLRQGRGRWGEPSPAEAAVLEAIDDIDRLERIADRVLAVGSWRELLDTP